MKKNRKVKFIIMIILMLAIAGMSLGFAAFSETLNISSSASVSANSSEFNLKLYGADSMDNVNFLIAELLAGRDIDESLLSSTVSVPYFNDVYGDSVSGSVASINSNSMSISNMNVSFTKPIYETDVSYVFFLKNCGKYAAYVDTEKISELVDANFSCMGLEGTTPALAEAACEFLMPELGLFSKMGIPLDESVILPGETAMMVFTWKYRMDSENVVLPDGPIEYVINNLSIPFTTKPLTDQNIE